MTQIFDFWKQCPKCGARNNIITDRFGGQVLCGGCGLVLEERLEEVVPAMGVLRTRDLPTAASIAKPDMGLTTIIGGGGIDGSGRAMSDSVRLAADRLRVWDYRSQARGGGGRSLKRALDELAKLSEKVSVSEAVVERAAYIYRKSIPMISMHGRSITTLVAAALYAACRSTQTPRTLKDIGDAANLDRLDIARSYRLLLTENEILQPVDDPSKCVSRIAWGAGLSTRVERRGLEILKKAQRAGEVTGNSPMGLAAASLYIASVLEGERSTKTRLAMVAGLTKVTIRNRCKALVTMLELDPDRFDDTKSHKEAPPSISPPLLLS
ncbi:MAG: transcription initiation factor IIB [Thaumarchaeota archaeon]|nr:transcription initiation factor IIB [Nitrososphaerota archaeon]